MQEGGLCLWDCEEPDSMHVAYSIVNGSKVPLRRPAYTTECHGSAEMAAAVVDVAVLPQPLVQPGTTLSLFMRQLFQEQDICSALQSHRV